MEFQKKEFVVAEVMKVVMMKKKNWDKCQSSCGG